MVLALVITAIYGFVAWSDTKREFEHVIREFEAKGTGNVEDVSILYDTMLLGVASFLTTAVLGLLILIFTTNNKKSVKYSKTKASHSVKAIEFTDEYKKCPDCAEQIRFKARKC